MRKRQGSFSASLVAVTVLVLLAASAYLGAAALAERRTAQGDKLLSAGQYAEALDSFKQAEKYNKFTLRKNISVTEGIAESSYELGDYAAARQYYDLVVKADPENATAVYKLGLIYIREKDYEKAGAQIKSLEEINTHNAQRYAFELSEMIREETIKGVLKDIYDKLAPNLPKIPGMTDNTDGLREKSPQEKNAEPKSGDRENTSPGVPEETEYRSPGGAGAYI